MPSSHFRQAPVEQPENRPPEVKRSSQKKIEANRRNASRSTGPRTLRGKQTVARNAIRHGILAREVVITAGDGQENIDEFEALLSRLCEHYQPVGELEVLLVQEIATCWWRKARILRAENGHIRKRLDNVDMEWLIRHSDQLNLSLFFLDARRLGKHPHSSKTHQELSLRERLAIEQESCGGLKRDYEGVLVLIRILETTKEQLKSQKYVEEGTYELLASAFGATDYTLDLPPEK